MTIKEMLKSKKIRSFLMTKLGFIPDSLYVSLFYFAACGKWPNLKNPKGYNEKLNWLKLHNKHPEYTILSDKLRVRDVVKEKLGEGHTLPLIGYWDCFDDIDFSQLPNGFVLKCNHDSGSSRIIKDKSALGRKDIEELKKFYDDRLSFDFSIAGREYPYKNIERCIIAEELMLNDSDREGGINDYKFFCFDGEPKLLLYVKGRQLDRTEDYFDMDYNWIPELTNGHHPSKICPPKPECFEEMKEMARVLSSGIKQVRMDFYEIDGKPYFGEYTFFSGGGFELFRPDGWEQRLGDWIQIHE